MKTKAKFATDCELCAGCQHTNGDGDSWCYMFREAPETLPCSQHDKFADLRKRVGKHTAAFMFITGELPPSAHRGINLR